MAECSESRGGLARELDRPAGIPRDAELVTTGNIADYRQGGAHCLPTDHALEVEPGCWTWRTGEYGQQRGIMTVWPNGRGATEAGADSSWGEWDDERHCVVLDDGEWEIDRDGDWHWVGVGDDPRGSAP